MSELNPLQQMQEQAGAGFMSYGPAEAQIQLVDSFGFYELEYAALRKGAGVLDAPQVGVVEVSGEERLDFLNRFFTHEVKALALGQCRRAFFLKNNGRIMADITSVALEKRTLLMLDRTDAAEVAQRLTDLIFSEDVQITDISAQHHVLAVHGPGAGVLLQAIGGADLTALTDLTAKETPLHGAACVVYRQDQAGVPGLHVVAPQDQVASVYEALAQQMGGLAPEAQAHALRADASKLAGRARAIGHLAFNTARIESGWPLFHVDFGPDSLPHETGVLEQAVSFTKGCYVGQEIVARMQHLGHPKKIVRGLRFEDDRMPVDGSEVSEVVEGEKGKVVGAVTSATLSPMLGGVAIALAVMKWGRHTKDTQVLVPAEGAHVPARVCDMKFI